MKGSFQIQGGEDLGPTRIIEIIEDVGQWVQVVRSNCIDRSWVNTDPERGRGARLRGFLNHDQVQVPIGGPRALLDDTVLQPLRDLSRNGLVAIPREPALVNSVGFSTNGYIDPNCSHMMATGPMRRDLNILIQ